MFRPKTVAFIGGDELDPLIQNAIQHKFQGSLIWVRVDEAKVDGIVSLPTVLDLEEAPDLAIVNYDGLEWVEAINLLEKIGCGGVVCLCSDQHHLTEKFQPEEMDKLRQVAVDMPVLGPVRYGLFNFIEGAIFTPQPLPRFSIIETGVALIGSDADYLAEVVQGDRNLPIAYAVEVGLNSIVSAADIFEFFLEDPAVSAIHVHFDELENIPRLSEVALKAARRGIPVVIVDGGRLAEQNEPTSGRLSQPKQSYGKIISTLYDRLGFIECKTVAEVIETLKMLIFTGRPLGKRLAVVGKGRSQTLLGANVAANRGFDVPEMDPIFSENLLKLLPEYTPANNPLIVDWEQGVKSENIAELYKQFVADNFNVAVKVIGSESVEKLKDSSSVTFKAIEAFANESFGQSLPSAVINTSQKPIPRAAAKMMAENNIAPLFGLNNGFSAIASSIKFVQKMILMAQMPGGAIRLPEPANIAFSSQYDEFDAKDILKKAGIWVPRSILLDGSSPFDISSLNYPMVTKVVSANILHKTEIGGVRLNLSTEKEVRDSIFEMGVMTESISTRGFLIEEMVDDGIAEMLVGVTHSPGIGQVLTMAMGGTAVELMRDSQSLVLPASSLEIETALRSLRLFPIINGYRGKLAADIDKVVESIAILASYAFSQRHRMYALEINPLIIRPFDYYPVAADAIIQVAKNGEDQG